MGYSIDKRKKETLPAGADPDKPFFIAVSIGNLDGTMDDIGGAGVEGLFTTIDEATACAKDLNDSYPSIDTYIFHCVPVRKVWRGAVRITTLNGADTVSKAVKIAKRATKERER